MGDGGDVMEREYIFWRTGLGCLTAVVALLLGLAGAARVFALSGGSALGVAAGVLFALVVMALPFLVDERHHVGKRGSAKKPGRGGSE